MKRLSQSDAQHVEAAEGWFELGNFREANAELDEVTPLFRAHPEVLEVRWRVLAAGKSWEGCLAIAETLTDQLPGRVEGWLMLAATQHGTGDTEGAYETLAGVADDFEDRAEVHYDLARYACLIGNYPDVLPWLEKAFEHGGKKLKLKALSDADLQAVWERIGKLQSGDSGKGIG